MAPDDCVMGDWDVDEVRRLFTSLEFRSLLRPAAGRRPAVKPKVEVAELDLREIATDELPALLASGAPQGVRLFVEEDRVHGIAVSAGGAQAAYAPLPSIELVAGFLTDAAAPKWAHDAKALERAASAEGVDVAGVTFDTMLAGYLLDPAAADYPLRRLCEAHLGTDVLGTVEDEAEGQLFGEAPWRATAAEAAAVALLAPVMEEQIDAQGLRGLLEDVELPLASVLARMEARGIALDVAYLEEMGGSVRDRMATLKAEIYTQAGEEFNLNSPPQLRKILYDAARPAAGQEDAQG